MLKFYLKCTALRSEILHDLFFLTVHECGVVKLLIETLDWRQCTYVLVLNVFNVQQSEQYDFAFSLYLKCWLSLQTNYNVCFLFCTMAKLSVAEKNHAHRGKRKYIEDIYFFEVNTKYISSNVLKISEISRVRSTSEIADIFNTWDEIFLLFTEKK